MHEGFLRCVLDVSCENGLLIHLSEDIGWSAASGLEEILSPEIVLDFQDTLGL